MEKLINFIKKHKIYILSFLLLFFLIRSCSKSGEIKKLSKQIIEYNAREDSIFKSKSLSIDSAYNQGYIDGMNKENQNILNHIDKSNRGVLPISVRKWWEPIAKDIEANVHRK